MNYTLNSEATGTVQNFERINTLEQNTVKVIQEIVECSIDILNPLFC